MNKPHQRIGSISNAHVGADFEKEAQQFFASKNIALKRNYRLKLGHGKKKEHCFDLGADSPQLIVECKSHRWTEGAKVPSAKMAVWNEAMYYFHLAPKEYQKILFVLRDKRKNGGETLLSYYKRTCSHLIPEGVTFFELDQATGDIRQA